MKGESKSNCFTARQTSMHISRWRMRVKEVKEYFSRQVQDRTVQVEEDEKCILQVKKGLRFGVCERQRVQGK